MFKKVCRLALAASVSLSCGLLIFATIVGLSGIPVFEPGFHELPVETKVDRARSNVIDATAALSRFIQQHGYAPQSVRALYKPVNYGSVSEGWFDPFSYRPIRRQFWPLRMLNSPSTITIYSVGPDGTDQFTSIAYDPTNGIISIGDIW